MSNYHQLRCKTCNDVLHEPRLNWGGDSLRAAIEHREQLVALRSLPYDLLQVGVKVGYRPLDLEWLEKHNDHELDVVSEYSELGLA